MVVPVDAGSEASAWGRVVRARTEAPLEDSRLLARVFADSGGAPVAVIAGGPHAPLTEQVLLDAFALAERRSLAGLRLYAVGPAALPAALEAVCRARAAHCEAVVWRPPAAPAR